MEILSTKKSAPPRILIHADHGLGKSSLAAAAPNPIFIQTEDGLDSVDAQAFPLCTTFAQVLEQLTWVYSQEHEFKTLVLDSLDWCETLIFRHVCTEGNKTSISEFGYGAGYTMALELFGKIIKALNAIREKHKMIIILIAHSTVKTYQNPMGADYDRFVIKLREKNAEIFKEWCDLIGFLHYEVFVNIKKDGFGETTKAMGGSNRVLSCAPSAAYVSKNRYWIKDDIQIPDPATGWANLVTRIKGA